MKLEMQWNKAKLALATKKLKVQKCEEHVSARVNSQIKKI